jgi:uncharacterized protein with FMN-binding domain
MSTRKVSLASGSSRLGRKALVSGFVLASYLAYAVHEHFAPPADAVAALPPATPSNQTAGVLPSDPPPAATVLPSPAAPTGAPEGVSPTPAAVPSQAVAARPASPQPSPTAPVQNVPAPSATPAATSGGQYKNGTFTGATADAFYGQVQVQVMINNGKISSVTFLNYPKDRRTSARINSFAVPYLQSEAIQAQSARVNIVSGATLTSEAFMVSLQSALNSARA